MAAKNINFHETFQPEMQYITKILELSMNAFSGDKYRISELTGIPTGKEKGKVEPHIKYAQYMGLISYTYNRGEYCLTVTPLGKEVWVQDKYMHETLTLWLLHYCITRKETGAPQWAFIVRMANSGFNRDVSAAHVANLIQMEFDITPAEASKALSVVKNSYQSGCFSALHYLDWNETIKFKERTEQSEYIFLYAYALLDCWNSMFPNKKEITFIEVINILEFGKVFGLNDEEVDSVLSSLEEQGFIRINRQLFPITIIRTADIESIVSGMYSMLM